MVGAKSGESAVGSIRVAEVIATVSLKGGGIQNVLPNLPEANSIAGAAEFQVYSTLKTTYGTHGQFDRFRGLTRNLMVEAERKP